MAGDLYQEMMSADLPSYGTNFKIPIYFFQGMEDDETPAALAEEYFQEIHSPRKDLVLFEGGGHFAVWSMADRFLRELTARVRPVAAQP